MKKHSDKQLAAALSKRPCMACGAPLKGGAYIAYRWEHFHVECFKKRFPDKEVKIVNG